MSAVCAPNRALHDGFENHPAVAWRLIDVLPAHPIITVPVRVTATERSKPQVNMGIDQLEVAGVLTPVSESKRNRSWEAVGLLDLLAALEECRSA